MKTGTGKTAMFKLRKVVRQVRKKVRRSVQKTSRELNKTATRVDNTATATIEDASQTATRVQKNVTRAIGGIGQAVNDTLLAAATLNANRTPMLQAVRFAHDQWRVQAKLQNIHINAVTATGTSDCLDGPDLDPLICQAPTVAALSGPMRFVRDAVAEGVGDCFTAWQNNVTVPGLPWYPSFAAYPGPMAPPMPNVPSPAIALVSTGVYRIMSQAQLKQAMWNAMPAALKKPPVDAYLDSIAMSLSVYFSTWLTSQQVMQVLGKGPVPTFAPPYVPVGPVVNGEIISTPGHFIAGALPMMV